jgi:hypothetical protein
MTTAAVLLWLVGALAGSMVFFGAVVAPLVFRVLPADAAGAFLRAFFPVYYIWGMALACVAAIVAVFVDWPSAALCIAVAVLFVFVRQVLVPRINQARDASLAGDADAGRRFERMHRLSVAINMLQLVALLVVAVRLIWWPAA